MTRLGCFFLILPPSCGFCVTPMTVLSGTRERPPPDFRTRQGWPQSKLYDQERSLNFKEREKTTEELDSTWTSHFVFTGGENLLPASLPSRAAFAVLHDKSSSSLAKALLKLGDFQESRIHARIISLHTGTWDACRAASLGQIRMFFCTLGLMVLIRSSTGLLDEVEER